MAKPYQKYSKTRRPVSKTPGKVSATPEKLPEPKTSRIGRMASRTLGGLGLMAYSPAVGEGSDKPKNYPGEGLKAKEKSSPAKPTATGMERYREPATSARASSAAAKPVSAPVKVSEYPPKGSSIDTTELKRYRDTNAADSSKAKPSTPASTKPVKRPVKSASTSSASARKSSASDRYDPNLDSSVAVGTTARASMGPSGMRYENTPRGQTFKKGGSVKSRGDGIAQRGHTKGRFV
jgi:hypothetical protein